MRSSWPPGALRPDAVRAALGKVPVRVLLVGPRAGELARMWAGAASEVVPLASAGELGRAPGPWDAVLLDGVLESERWDRWLVQRVHGLLAPGGVLVLTARNLLDVWSLGGLGHLVSRAGREVRRRLAPRTAIPTADRSLFTQRRHRPRQLASMVSGTGFDVLSTEMSGQVLSGALGRRTAGSIALLARRIPSLWGPDREFPNCGAHTAAFAAIHAAELARRDEWRRANGTAGAPREVDVEDWSRRGAVVFAPHPDDEVIGCGGTLLDLAGRGGAVSIVQVTDGSDSAAFIDEPESVRRQVRLDEARIVADRMGARELVCLRADNRALRPTPALRERFRECVERSRAGLVFAPSFTDFHPDHQTVLRLLASALREVSGPKPDVVLYEVWSLVAPTHVRVVNARMHELEALLLAYETALKVDDYVHLVADRLLFNSCAHRGHAGYLEAFEVLGADRFLELAAAHFEPRAGSRPEA